MHTKQNSSRSQRSIVVSPRSGVEKHKSIAAAFRHMQASEWQQTFGLMATVHQQGVELVAQMAQCDWPYVTGLGLAHSQLGHAAMIQLAKGTWPRLQRLVLTGNQLDEAAIGALIKGKWPLLTSLVLDANSSLSSAAIALLPRAANWASLSELSLAQMHLDSSCLRSVALLHKQLQNLSLAFKYISTAALSPCLGYSCVL